jgi:hypothetical protein
MSEIDKHKCKATNKNVKQQKKEPDANSNRSDLFIIKAVLRCIAY